LVQDHTGFTALTHIYHSPVPQAGTDAPRCPSRTKAKSYRGETERKRERTEDEMGGSICAGRD